MSWLERITPPGLTKVLGTKKNETPDNLWIKCPTTGEMLFREDLERNYWVTPSGHHFRVSANERLKQLFESENYEVIDTPDVKADPLKFKDSKSYAERIKAARNKTGSKETMAIAIGRIKAQPALVIVQDFAFLGGSLGMAAGEAFVKAAKTAVERELPLVMVTSSGGARMQESVLSLMQMPRTVIAVQKLKEAALPYIVVLADPTTGGVTASYAMLGDIQIAEPGALIGFTGPRVIEKTIRQKLPQGFQSAEFVREKGMIDRIVERKNLASELGTILKFLMASKRMNIQNTETETAVMTLQESEPTNLATT